MSDTSVVVIGGGISGLTTAIEAAEAGCDVHIVERNPYLGGRVAQLNKYFPKLCPPVCGLEINMRRIKENPRIKFHTLAEVKSIKKSGGRRDGYFVSITENPRYVNGLCVGCGECAKACPAKRPNDFNFGMDSTKAAYLPFEQAFPFHYVIDRTRCKGDCGNACVQACKYNAIELGMKPGTLELEVDSVVLATGWDPYDAARMETLGYGRLKNVITNMMMERLAAPNGPTQGRILRPSDGREAKRVAFVQCAGSRDEDHLPYCSYVCCMASIKQAKYLRDLYPDSTAEIFYIDMRTPGRYEQFYEKVRADQNVTFTKGKVAKVQADPETGDVVVVAEDVLGGKKIKRGFDMVVLATGMQPAMKGSPVPGEIPMTGEGFVNTPALTGRLFAVGTAKSPVDVARSVQDGTGVAIKAMRGGGAARPSDKGAAHPSDKRAARPSDKRAAARQGGRADG